MTQEHSAILLICLKPLLDLKNIGGGGGGFELPLKIGFTAFRSTNDSDKFCQGFHYSQTQKQVSVTRKCHNHRPTHGTQWK